MESETPQMLNLLHLRQKGLKEEADAYEISATCNVGVPQCNCLLPNVVRNGKKTLYFQDTPMHGKRVSIAIELQRYRCQTCKTTHYPEVHHMHERHRMTQRLYDYICKNGTLQPWKALAAHVGLEAQTISDIWNAWAEEQLKTFCPVTPEWLGVDELFIMGKYRAVFTNIRERTLITMLEDREFSTMHGYCTERLDPSKVEVVTMDMHEPYRKFVRLTFPKAKIVVDRFHVMMYASKAVEAARVSLRSQLNKKKRVGLLGDRWLFLTAREKLTPWQTNTLAAVLEQYPVIKEAYGFKESFRDVWKAPTQEEAMARLKDWEAQVRASQSADVFAPLLSCLTNWHTEIFAYMEWKLTNAYTESFNALARRMDTAGHGYSFEGLKKRLLMRYGIHRHEEPSSSSTPGLAAFIQRGGWLGLDLSTLADEVGNLPEN